ncbi:tyrosine-type recombinase/integrase [Endozoicomonas lisbonensis]|uniref:Integrase n=1 Tax=Endozoicomonas lisbonensis TaxID=3120522 RepID=A0ABV2SNK7_9GAMM
MASYEERIHGWLVRIHKFGVRESKTFDTKEEAESWANKREEEIAAMGSSEREVAKVRRQKVTLRQCFERYIKEVSPKKKGKETALREGKRFMQFCTNPSHEPLGSLMDKKMSKIEPHHIAEWKLNRLNHVTNSSVVRDKNFLSHVFSTAREWGYIEETPFGGKVKFSEDDDSDRDRRVTDQEIEEVLFALDDWDRQRKPETPRETVALLWCLCLETGMRLQEVKFLEAAEIDLESGVIDLPRERVKEKRKKSVALTDEAIRLIQLGKTEEKYWFDSNKLNVSSIFSLASRQTTIENLQFRDSRHEALTRLSEKLKPFELARQAGHRDMNRTLKYYRKTAREYGQKLRD